MRVFAVALGLQQVFVAIWAPPLTLVASYGSAFVIGVTAIGSTWVTLLQRLNYDAVIRGVWCHIYAVFGIAVAILTELLVL